MPPVGTSSAPKMFIRVDFPDPDAPIIAIIWPDSLQRNAAQGMHLKISHAVDLGYIFDVDERLVVLQGDILFSLREERKLGLRSSHTSSEHP